MKGNQKERKGKEFERNLEGNRKEMKGILKEVERKWKGHGMNLNRMKGDERKINMKGNEKEMVYKFFTQSDRAQHLQAMLPAQTLT